MAAIVAAIGWLIGLYNGPTLPPQPVITVGACVVAAAGCAVLWRGVPGTRLMMIVVIAAVLGIARVQLVVPENGPGTIARWVGGGSVDVRGTIAAEPEMTDGRARLHIRTEEARGRGRVETVSGTLLATVPGQDWRFGDHIAIVGIVNRPIDRDGAPVATLLNRQDIHAVMRADSARKLDDDEAATLIDPEYASSLRHTWIDVPIDQVRGGLYDVKRWAAASLDRRLPMPESALAQGLLLGGNGGMPSDLVESFRRSGMTHVVAVSGYNIALVAAAVVPISRAATGRIGAFWLPMLAIVGFTIGVGAPASAVRAAIMGSLVLLARLVGRPSDALTALAVAAIAMTAFDPNLLGDLGFILSSLATIALITLYPWIDERLPGRGNGDPPRAIGMWIACGVRETLVACLAVEILAVPVIAVAFGRVAILSPLANILALPAIPLAMATSVPIAVSGFLPDWLATPFAWIAWVPLAWIIAVIELCAAPAWASLSVGPVASVIAWTYYALAAMVILGIHAGSYRGTFPSPMAMSRRLINGLPPAVTVGGSALFAIAAWAAVFTLPQSAPRVTLFESSGATLIRTAEGHTIVIGPGSSGLAIAADLGRTLPFWQNTLDLLVLTDQGDAPSIAELARRYQIVQIAAARQELSPNRAGQAQPNRTVATTTRPMASVAVDGDDDTTWLDDLEQAGFTVVIPDEGRTVRLSENIRLQFVQTPAPTGALSTLLFVGPTRVLISGESASAALLATSAAIGQPVDVVIASVGARQPARAANLTTAALAQLAPQMTLLYVPPVPPGGQPPVLPIMTDRQRIIRTDEHGTIELAITGSGLDVRSRR